jgi:hypothetical protein
MGNLTERRFSLMHVVVLPAVALSLVVAVAYGTVTIPNTFSPGTTISSSQMNQNFSAITTAFPSVASAYAYNWGTIDIATGTGQSNLLRSVTVTPPADGYLYVVGTGTLTIEQTTAGSNTIYAWVKLVGSGSGPERRMALNTTGAAPITISNDMHVTGLFPVTGGTPATINLEAIRDNSGANTASYGQTAMLQVIFIPNQLACTPNSPLGSPPSSYGMCN